MPCQSRVVSFDLKRSDGYPGQLDQLFQGSDGGFSKELDPRYWEGGRENLLRGDSR